MRKKKEHDQRIKKARFDTSTKSKKVAKKKEAVEKSQTSEKKKIETAKKPRVPKTRNAGTQTESSFWRMLISSMRRLSMYWKPIQIAKESARREYNGSNKRQKWEYMCAHCKNWFMDKDIAVDHIIPVGSLKCSEDLAGYVERLFCEDGFQCLCSACHDIKTEQDIKNIRS